MATTQAPEPKVTPAPATVWVKATRGEFHNIFNGTVYGADPKKIEVDAWLQAQIDANKLTVVQP